MKNYNIKDLEREAIENLKEGKVKSAEVILEKILLINDNNTTALNLLALCKYMYCDFDSAHKLWKISYGKDKNVRAKYFLDIYNNVNEVESRRLFELSLVEIKSGKYIEAREYMTKVIFQNKLLIPPKIILATLDMERKNINEINAILENYKIDESNIQNKNLYIEILEEINLRLRNRNDSLIIVIIVIIIVIFIYNLIKMFM